jgi:diguanylate cyclase (GGDEF)-like protein/putative nucleotidyltransferase with HDIG domain
MSTAPATIESPETPQPEAAEPRLPRAALAFYLLIGAAAFAAAGPHLEEITQVREGWFAFFVFATGAALAQLFVVVAPRRGRNSEGTLSYHTTGVFLLPAALLLAPPLAALVPVVQHLPEWLKKRQPWYIATFNIFNYTLTVLAALYVNKWVLERDGILPNANARIAAAGIAASVAYVLVNHGVLAMMFRLGRKISIRESGLFATESVSAEFVLAALGVGVAALWTSNPWLLPLVLAPIVLINRSLAVPALQLQARVDPKTGLFNARHFAAALADELARAQRFDRPLALMMADLDLLRDINNDYGHLAGDAVLRGVADVFREELRHYDIPARFGGEEFSILLPETSSTQALEIAERIRRSLAARRFEVETSTEPIRATISIGIAEFPANAAGPDELVHEADLAVYRAKLQGRNRVVAAGPESSLLSKPQGQRLASVPDIDVQPEPAAPAKAPYVPLVLPKAVTSLPRPARAKLRGVRRAGLLTALVGFVGITAGVAGVLLGTSTDLLGLVFMIALVGGGQALALNLEEGGIALNVIGALAGAALFGPRAALVLAIAAVAADWSARRLKLEQLLFDAGVMTLGSLAAAGIFAVVGGRPFVVACAGVAAGLAYFAIDAGLHSLALALGDGESFRTELRKRLASHLLHYLAYGFVAGGIAFAYDAAGVYALAVFAVPVLLMRKTQQAYIAYAQRSARNLQVAAEEIRAQNLSLALANRLLKERSTETMESLSASVDARDSYTTGHSRRVRQLADAIGRQLGLSQPELDVLGQAALFHDIGKLAIPDAILLKSGGLDDGEWSLMRDHAEEGARIIERLGFLGDAVPAIKHHHERFDGTGYPDRLRGEEIPLGARIIHVADALDSMLTSHVYRSARPADEALAELRRGEGTQFCPRCVAALHRALSVDIVLGDTSLLATAS